MADFIILSILCIGIAGAYIYRKKRKKAGKGCCGEGDCGGCNECPYGKTEHK